MSREPGESGLDYAQEADDAYELSVRDQAAARTEGLELAGQLGSGRGARTWLAKEEQSREKFTVTFATGTSAEDRQPQQVWMARVAEHWAGTTHPNLVPVRGTIGSGDSVEALVTDHVEGISLAQRIAQDGRVPASEISPILTAVAAGLGTLHDHGWVHGTLSPNSILLGKDERVWVDGYGLPVGSASSAPGDDQALADPVVSWGHDDRPEVLDRSVARTPPDDVKALATLAWVALTGRVPGSDSHRVPLTLVCPAASRGLVLMLEAALSDEPATRPTAHEFAAGIAAIPTAKTAPKVARIQSPQIVRADGTEVKLGRPRRPMARRGSSATTATVSVDRPWQRPLVLALAATALTGCAWFGIAELTGEEFSTVAVEQGESEQRTVENDDSEPGGPAADAVAPPDQSRDAAPPAQSDKPGPVVSEAVENAARELVASRAQALATGDGTALAAVYVPESRLAESDRSTIVHAAGQDGVAGDDTALSGLSMEVDRMEPVSGSEPAPGDRGTSPDGQAHTFYAEILTGGWHGEIPERAHVDREGTTVRQTVHLTVTETDDGWRIVDVTPVERKG